MSPSISRRRRIAALTAVTLVLLSAVSGVAAAQSGQQVGGTIVVEEGETVDSLQGAAGTIVVRGTVTGDLSSAAGTIRITETGTVQGNVESAGGSVVIAGTVGGNVQVGAGSFELTSTGRIDGSLDVGAGAVVVDGAVGEDVRAAGDSVTLGPNADVGGEFRYDADEFTRSSDATVAGDVVEDPSLRGETGGFGPSLPSWTGTVYGFVTSLLLGALLLLVAPQFSSGVAARVAEEPVTTGAVGLLALLGIPILLALVLVTIVGIPFAVAGAVVYALGLWIASVYGKYAVGAWALARTGRENRWLALVGALVAFLLLGQIPVIGGLAEFLALLLGFGALALGLRDRYRGEEATEASSVAAAE